MNMYRQGDLLFVELSGPPKGNRRVRRNGHILEGEVTGHVHAVADVEAAQVFDVGKNRYMTVSEKGGVAITHPEHDKLDLPKGYYRVRRQREFKPRGSGSQVVQD